MVNYQGRRSGTYLGWTPWTAQRTVLIVATWLTAALSGLLVQTGYAQVVAPKVKIYRADSLLYPFVQIYFRTLDQERKPFINLNAMNVGIMVQGKPYDPHKGQYGVQTLSNRQEPIRAVIVLDASRSMTPEGLTSAREAAASFIDSKRPTDQVAILVIRDTKDGYETLSDFERDGGALGRRLGQVREPSGAETRLYDTVGAAMTMCAGPAQGGTSSEDAEYIPSCSILVFSDGSDAGSAAFREELINRISQMPIPIPIYTFSPCTQQPVAGINIKNLQSLSNNSFGKFYDKCEVRDVHHILQNDYVVTFRSYLPVDGASHPVKLGIEYPSGTGKIIYDQASFEANQALPVQAIQSRIEKASARIPALPDGNPYTAGTAGEQQPKKKGVFDWLPFSD